MLSPVLRPPSVALPAFASAAATVRLVLAHAVRARARGTLELYDRASDPGELVNLSDDIDVDQQEHVLLMRRFFQVHTYRENGYRVSYVE